MMLNLQQKGSDKILLGQRLMRRHPPCQIHDGTPIEVIQIEIQIVLLQQLAIAIAVLDDIGNELLCRIDYTHKCKYYSSSIYSSE